MKKLTNANHTGVVTDIEKQKLLYSSQDLLEQVKKTEKKLKKKLKRVNTTNGYIMTTDPEKWDEYKL
jgi:tetrahydromethanopterin S-methyltransferase subunit B